MKQSIERQLRPNSVAQANRPFAKFRKVVLQPVESMRTRLHADDKPRVALEARPRKLAVLCPDVEDAKFGHVLRELVDHAFLAKNSPSVDSGVGYHSTLNPHDSSLARKDAGEYVTPATGDAA